VAVEVTREVMVVTVEVKGTTSTTVCWTVGVTATMLSLDWVRVTAEEAVWVIAVVLTTVEEGTLPVPVTVLVTVIVRVFG